MIHEAPLTNSEIEAMVGQFHDHVDHAILNACQGRYQRAAAYLAAARRLVDSLPTDIVGHFEISGHLAGVIRGLSLESDEPAPRTAA